jgi:hypothetical protein
MRASATTRSKRALTGVLAGLLVPAGLTVLPASEAGSAEAATPARRVVYTAWDTDAAFARGTADGVRAESGWLRLDRPRLRWRGYDAGRWTSPWVRPGFSLTELVASWQARTPGDSWVQLSARGRTASGRTSSWDVLGRWAAGDRHLRRTTLGAQVDDLARVSYDTLLTGGLAGGFRDWQLRVALFRRTGTSASPRVNRVGAMVSRLPATASVPTSRPARALGTTLPVPRYSQMAHAGSYRQYGGGGEAWCSPTSVTMVLGYYGALPSARALAWVRRGHPDPEVVYAARQTYDRHLAGTGNWPFNTAYAGRRTGHAFVTRLRSLREAERFIEVGIPLVASVRFGRGELDGAPISSTNGHLLVVVGFTRGGDVVVNDPAARTRAGVRRTYDRGQFEDAWLRRSSAGGSGGLVYVVRDAAHRLPARQWRRNW